ncbi:LADA_0D10594g1_1 [Lachancea dasiensis]|uniref:LADA_0D10594g1_1 n=1 Tax=Lachancea dasiensis TaxID=1072105 RepID=A0A1G4J7T0_9SACH|nr:LADA_0D10594g1_1 [Lachancea dasiensis]
MELRLVMVDPRPSAKLSSVTSKDSNCYKRQSQEVQDKKTSPVIIHTFNNTAALKSSGMECRRAGGSRNMVTKPKNGIKGERQPQCIGKKSAFESLPPVPRARKANGNFEKTLTFVSSVVGDFNLEYANAWQSSLNFDGNKPQRPLFRIANRKFRRPSIKKDGSLGTSNVIDPNFSFSYNSLNLREGKNSKPRTTSFDTSPLFRVSYNNR